MEDKKPHLSVSQIRTLARCAIQWEYRYVQGLKRPPGVALVQGSAWHEGAEHADRHKMETGELAYADEVADVAAEAFDRRVREEEPDLEGRAPGALKDEVVGWTRLYHSEIAPQTNPTLVEEKFIIDRGEYDLIGFIDLVDGDVLVDRKSAARSIPQGDADQSVQLSVYSAHLGAPREARLDVVVKTKTPKVQQVQTARTQEQTERALRIADQAWEVAKSGAFLPNTEGWHCSQRFCGYWDICPYR